jgi:predicted DNA-binding protein (MmcQ/YjbR family)
LQLEAVRKHCLSFPGATETVQWGSDLVFKIGGKMFAVCATEPAKVCMSFKCSPDDFADLTERPRIIPAPYLARAQWVALESDDALPATEAKKFLRQAYDIVFAKLPKSQQAKLNGGEKK